MADPFEIISVLKTLSAAYPEKTLTKGVIDIYINGLFDVPLQYLQQAALSWIKSSPWFPKVSDLHSQALKIAGAYTFIYEPKYSYASLRDRQIKLQADYAHGEPFDEKAWRQLIVDFEASNLPESAEHNRRRLAYYLACIAEEESGEDDGRAAGTGDDAGRAAETGDDAENQAHET